MAAPRRPRSPLRFRRGLRCLLGRHDIGYWRLRAPGERWSTFIYLCKRCNRVVGDSHAVKSIAPRV